MLQKVMIFNDNEELRYSYAFFTILSFRYFNEYM